MGIHFGDFNTYMHMDLVWYVTSSASVTPVANYQIPYLFLSMWVIFYVALFLTFVN